MSEHSTTRRNSAPVTNPVRVALIDPSIASRQALGRAIDLDPALAVVALCADPRRAVRDLRRAAPDVVAIRLHIDDPECAELLADLAQGGPGPAVLVLGRAFVAPVDAAALVARIKAVALAGDPGPVARDRGVASRTSAGHRLH